MTEASTAAIAAPTASCLPDASFWGGKRVLLTGHTGFKGAWLALWLQRLGADVTGLALAPVAPSLYDLADLDRAMASRIADLRDAGAVACIVREARPQNFRMSSIVLGVVKSQPFQMRKSR